MKLVSGCLIIASLTACASAPPQPARPAVPAEDLQIDSIEFSSVKFDSMADYSILSG